MTIMERAVVERWPTYGLRGMTWLAHHDECGWCEELTAWHNAFWAADHHVRYDCGRREQVSGGGYETFEQGQTRMRAHLVDHERGGPYESWVPELYSPGEAAEVKARFEAAYKARVSSAGFTPLVDVSESPQWQEDPDIAAVKAAYEGGMQDEPTPSDMSNPPGGESAEGPTVELGAITAEVGVVDGDTEGQYGGSTGWWAGLWGKGHGR